MPAAGTRKDLYQNALLPDHEPWSKSLLSHKGQTHLGHVGLYLLLWIPCFRMFLNGLELGMDQTDGERRVSSHLPEKSVPVISTRPS